MSVIFQLSNHLLGFPDCEDSEALEDNGFDQQKSRKASLYKGISWLGRSALTQFQNKNVLDNDSGDKLVHGGR